METLTPHWPLESLHSLIVLQKRVTVSRKLGSGRATYAVGCVGSVFKSNIVLDNFKEMLQREAKTVEFRGPYVDHLPLMESVTMAFKELQGRSFSETLLKTISENLNDVSQPSRNRVSASASSSR